MAGVEAPKGQGAPLMRTKRGTGRYMSSRTLHAARVWSNYGSGLEAVQLTSV